MTAEQDDDDVLGPFLRAGRAGEPVSDALMARVLADAASVQAQLAPAPPGRPAGPARGGWWAAIQAALGGPPAIAGVTLAGLAGLLIGILVPDVVDGLSGGQIGVWSAGAGALPEIGLLWEEGGDV
ncbi:MAG: hypothetical protein RLZZ491_1771 [Pseudomonadota bacterium]|jgi:hypothetical protein